MISFRKKSCIRALLTSTVLCHSVTSHSAQAAPHVNTTVVNTNNASAAQATITVQAGEKGKKISPDLFGLFFEDLNYAADGGLYAELIQNRSFEYSSQDREGWNALTGWELVERGGAKGRVAVDSNQLLHANNPHHAVLTVEPGINPNEGFVGLRNAGFDGIVLRAGEEYNFSVFARNSQNPPRTAQPAPMSAPLTVRLESKDGALLGQATITGIINNWRQFSATLRPQSTDLDARLVIGTTGVGSVTLDMVSLFPKKTFRNRPNGLRADIAQTLADLKPKFMRFPGGCVAHGDGIDNIYNWKNTIGPVERRKEQPNIWRYHQTTGLGYFEYFQFCEDIGAKPLPVVAAGVSCQNSNLRSNGQQCIPLANMDEYIQDLLDLVEYANGPATSIWGAKRAAAGHPKPFNLEYLGVGNEDRITPEFRERFAMIYKAVKAKYPKLTVIGTVGPGPAGQDYEQGWKFANELKVDMVDEHYYEVPEWLLNNLNRYDTYDRKKSKVYVGEYASWGNSLFNAISEAAYMTSLERNGDVVHMASYAPLIANPRHINWSPNLIYFDNTAVAPSVNYYVQQLYGHNSGDTYLPNTVAFTPPKASLPVNVFVGTWNTQAQFEQVQLQSGADSESSIAPDRDGSGWSRNSGAWVEKNGTYTQSGNEQPALYKVTEAQVVTKSGKLTYTYSLRARKTAGQEGFLIGFGATDDANYLWWNLGGWGNTQHGIERFVNGSSNLVGKVVPGNIETGRWYDIKIEVDGQRIRCFLDGKIIHDVVDDGKPSPQAFVSSCVRDSKSGELILKLVNVSPFTVQSKINLAGLDDLKPTATQTVLSGDPRGTNSFDNPRNIVPQTVEIRVQKSFDYVAPPHSFTIIRMKTRG